MASVDNVSSSSSSQQVVTDSAKNILGKDDFLKLLITQLKYQDPLEPTDNKDFIAQMAQFSSLEQMNNMTTSLDQLSGIQQSTLRELTVGQAVNMIGHTVSAVMPSDTITGKISSETALYYQADENSPANRTLAKDTAVTMLAQEGNMIKVQLADGTTGYIDGSAFTPDEAPREVGVVTGMKIVDGAPYVTVNGKDIPLSLIEAVNMTEAASTTEPANGDNSATTP